MYLVDTHCHLWHPEFSLDVNNIIKEAQDSNVRYLINVGINPPSNIESYKIAREFKKVYSTIGFHPHYAKDFRDDYKVDLEKLLKKKKIVAIGEIGLDYYRNLSNHKVQKQVFEFFLNLAQKFSLPVIIHNRDANEDILSILDKFPELKNVIMHCFSSNLDFLKECLERNYFISYAGNCSYDEKMKPFIDATPVDKILVETDSPFLPPASRRGKRNEPKFVTEVAWHIAKIKNIALKDFKRTVAVTTKRIFDIGDVSLEPKFVYEIGENLYINLTNDCINNCEFCIKNKTNFFFGYNLKLKKEPSSRQILKAISKPEKYKEIVFCGYGEPLLRLEKIKKIARKIKKHNVKIRIVTNGEANLVYKRNILFELKDLIDKFSISLNFTNSDDYFKICKPSFGKDSFSSIIDFIKKAKEHFEVEVTFIEFPNIDKEECQKLSNKLGVNYRMRRLVWGWE